MTTDTNQGSLRAFTNYAEPELRDENDKLFAVLHGRPAADARRLAACWNACQGISTDTLKRYYGNQGGIDAALEEASLRDHVTAVQQRDALLAHLEQLLTSSTAYASAIESDHGVDLEAWAESARATIASIKGGA